MEWKAPTDGLAPKRADTLVCISPHVARHVVVIVIERCGSRVAAVVPHVEHDHVVAPAQKLPKRQVAVDGEPVAVAGEDANAGIRVAVTAHRDMRPVGHRQIDGIDGLRDFENAQRTILPALLDRVARASTPVRGGPSIPKRRPAAKCGVGRAGQVVTDRKFSLSLRS